MDMKRAYFDEVAKDYIITRKTNIYTLEHAISLMGIRPAHRVLDVGCGVGTLLPYICRQAGIGGKVEELDFSPAMIKECKSIFKSAERDDRISFICEDICKYKVEPERYGTIILWRTYPYLEAQQEYVIKKLATGLQPGGSIIIGDDRSREKANHEVAHLYGMPLPTIDVLCNTLLSCGLTIYMAMDTEKIYFVRAVKAWPTDDTHSHDHNDEQKHHSHVHSHRETKNVLNRLARISGHIHAITRMVEEGRDCSDVLVQLSSVKSAINNCGKIILHDHIDHCIVEAVEHEDQASLDNLKDAIDRFVK